MHTEPAEYCHQLLNTVLASGRLPTSSLVGLLSASANWGGFTLCNCVADHLLCRCPFVTVWLATYSAGAPLQLCGWPFTLQVPLCNCGWPFTLQVPLCNCVAGHLLCRCPFASVWLAIYSAGAPLQLCGWPFTLQVPLCNCVVGHLLCRCPFVTVWLAIYSAGAPL